MLLQFVATRLGIVYRPLEVVTCPLLCIYFLATFQYISGYHVCFATSFPSQRLGDSASRLKVIISRREISRSLSVSWQDLLWLSSKCSASDRTRKKESKKIAFHSLKASWSVFGDVDIRLLEDVFFFYLRAHVGRRFEHKQITYPGAGNNATPCQDSRN